MKYAYAANRDLGARVLEFLIAEGFRPEVLFLTDEEDPDVLEIARLANLPESRVFRGKGGLQQAKPLLSRLDLDYVLGIHYPYLVKRAFLQIPKHGFLNLHPAYLPFNRGWHTPSWAILEGTPAGATLHVMSEELDRGDILHQKRVEVGPADTADSLYQRLKQAEFEVFREAWPAVRDFVATRTPQGKTAGTVHRRQELLEADVAELDLDKSYLLRDLLRRLRALTTSDLSEACYFVEEGRRFRVAVRIEEETAEASDREDA